LHKEKLILKNISIKFKKGTTTALVGQSGAGKTTIIDLLMRCYDPINGEILLDDKYNLKEVDT